MGTRATVKFKERYTAYKNEKLVVNVRTICAIYSQYDGYIDGLGRELGEFMVNIEITNGLKLGGKNRTANGMGCLAAQFIQEIKDGAGGIYMTNIEDSQGYDYEVIGGYDENMNPIEPVIKVTIYGELKFEGSAQELLDFKYE